MKHIPLHSSLFTWKKKSKWSKRRKDSYANQIYICSTSYCVSNVLFDSAIIVSIKKTVLILELRTLMKGAYLFCLQQYRYCFASSKIWFTNIIFDALISAERLTLSFPSQIKSNIILFASSANSLSNDIKLVRYKKIGITKVSPHDSKIPPPPDS